jgi:hypothetical protein
VTIECQTWRGNDKASSGGKLKDLGKNLHEQRNINSAKYINNGSS